LNDIDLYFIEYIKETEYYMFNKVPFTDNEILDAKKETFTYSLFENAYVAFKAGIKELEHSINDGNIKSIATLKTNIMIGYIEIIKKRIDKAKLSFIKSSEIKLMSINRAVDDDILGLPTAGTIVQKFKLDRKTKKLIFGTKRQRKRAFKKNRTIHTVTGCKTKKCYIGYFDEI